MSYCTKCGKQMEDDAVFCSACGTNSQVNTPNPSGTANESSEVELYKKNGIGYTKGITQSCGTFIITNKRILFRPMAIYLLVPNVSIRMEEIVNATRASIMGINYNVRIYTTKSNSYLFNIGILNAKDVDKIIDIINSNKKA